MVTPRPSATPKQPSRQHPALAWAGRLGQPPVMSTLAASAVVLALSAVGALQGLELGLNDQMMRLRPVPPPDTRILVVGIDEADIQARQEWPIEDSTLVELLTVVTEAEPRVIGLDLFRDIPVGDGQDELISQIQNADHIYAVCKMSSSDNPGVPPPTGLTEAQVGFSDLVVDSGGILRRSLLIAAPPAESEIVDTHLCNSPEAQLFSLSLQLALRYLAEDGINPELTAQQELRLADIILPRLSANLGGYRNVDAQGYQIMLNYRAVRTAVPQVSVSDVLSGAVNPAQMRDRIVIIGATTPEAKDEFYTPFSGGLRDSQQMSGVIVHAQSVSQILSAVLDDRPLIWSWSTGGEVLWIILWALGGALFACYIRRPLVFAVGAIALVAGLYGVCYLLFLQGGWIPLVPAALALGLASGGVVLLDRFNKSDYGQAVYKQMKSLLRLEIEIDQSKVGEQVAEITDTDYFSKLQAQAKELRERRQSLTSRAMPPARIEKPGASTEGAAAPPTGPASTPDITSSQAFIDSLKQQADRLKTPDDDTERGD
ncbi:MAG: CHASE2 domain-containing protein [Leptolyngbyaceae cyanobacterium]